MRKANGNKLVRKKARKAEKKTLVEMAGKGWKRKKGILTEHRRKISGVEF